MTSLLPGAGVAIANDAEPKDLWSLLEPLTQAEFATQYWQRGPLHHRAPPALVGRTLLSVDEIDSVLHRAAANAGEFDFYTAGSAMPQSHWAGLGNYVLLNRLLGLYAKGGTIHVSNIQKYSDRIGRFCKTVQKELLADCEADLWMTRHNQFEPYLHFDRYDIFVVQVHGRKRWRLFNRLALPEDRKGAALAWDEVGDPVIDVVAEPGDVIYIPPHTPHVVTTVEAQSIHLGIGLHPLTWRQVLAFALDESKSRPGALDEVVPLDFIRSLGTSSAAALAESLRRAGAAIESVEPNRFAERIFDDFLANVTHPRDEQLSEGLFGDREPVEAATRVIRRDGVMGRVSVDGPRAVLRYSGGGEISAPVSYRAALESLLSSEVAFSAEELDTSLALDDRIALVRRAVDAGVCKRGR